MLILMLTYEYNWQRKEDGYLMASVDRKSQRRNLFYSRKAAWKRLHKISKKVTTNVHYCSAVGG